SAGGAPNVFVLDLTTQELVGVPLAGFVGGPVAFAADGRSFAATVYTSGSRTPGEIRVFETASGRERLRIGDLPGRVESLAFFPDGRRLASGLSDSSVLIWDLTALRKE